MARICKLLLGLGLLLQTVVAHAIRLESGSEVTINRRVSSDLYIAGTAILVNAPIEGDLLAAGRSITVNDSIGGDLIVAGETVIINGYVGDDIRMAGGTLRISQSVYGDVIVFGGKVLIDQEAVIYGDLIANGGEIRLNGTVKGNIDSRGGTVYLNGNGDKVVNVRAEKLYVNGSIRGNSTLVAEDIHVSQQASLYNNVRYWQISENNPFGSSLKNGRAVFDPSLRIAPSDRQSGVIRMLIGPFILFYLGSALLLIFLFQYLLPEVAANAAQAVRQDTVKCLGYGLLYLIGIPALVVLLLVTLVGIPVGLLVLSLYIFSVVFAFVITAVIMANWLNQHYQRNWSKLQLAAVAFGLYFLIRLLAFVPVVGWFVVFLIVGTVFGSIVSMTIPSRRVAATA